MKTEGYFNWIKHIRTFPAVFFYFCEFTDFVFEINEYDFDINKNVSVPFCLRILWNLPLWKLEAVVY